MRVDVSTTQARSILTRASGYLTSVCSHSLQPYRGCSFGQSLCGVGCYVQHNRFLTHGAPWGSFLVAKTNAAALYEEQYGRERQWARDRRRTFSIFMSSATDPFVPHEREFGVTRQVLAAMLEQPPDELIVQTHTHLVTRELEALRALSERTALRVHVSIESDRTTWPGLPPPPSTVEKRFDALLKLGQADLTAVATVSPLLPIEHPRRFFERIRRSADWVVIDHFIGGDGSKNGARTRRTRLPESMERLESGSSQLCYRDQMIEVAQDVMPGRVGVGIEGFAGRLL